MGLCQSQRSVSNLPDANIVVVALRQTARSVVVSRLCSVLGLYHVILYGEILEYLKFYF